MLSTRALRLPHRLCVCAIHFFLLVSAVWRAGVEQEKKSSRLFLNVKPCHGIPIECTQCRRSAMQCASKRSERAHRPKCTWIHHNYGSRYFINFRFTLISPRPTHGLVVVFLFALPFANAVAIQMPWEYRIHRYCERTKWNHFSEMGKLASQ